MLGMRYILVVTLISNPLLPSLFNVVSTGSLGAGSGILLGAVETFLTRGVLDLTTGRALRATFAALPSGIKMSSTLSLMDPGRSETCPNALSTM